MGEFKINLSKREYLELKKQALLDRIQYVKEIDQKKEKLKETRDCIVNACADEYGYNGEERLAYCTNFLIPDDYEFDEFYQSTKSKFDCKDYFCVDSIMIHNKVFLINKFGKYRNLEEVDEALNLLYNEETIHPLETLELQEDASKEKNMEKLDFSIEETAYDEDDFDTLDKKADDTAKKVEQTHQYFSPLAGSKENDVEKQTEEALEKINYLFQKNDNKDQKISNLEKENEEKTATIASLETQLRINEDVITSLETQIISLKEQKALLEEKIEEVNARNISLEEENKALIKQNEVIIAAINEKYGEYVEKPQGKTK